MKTEDEQRTRRIEVSRDDDCMSGRMCTKSSFFTKFLAAGRPAKEPAGRQWVSSTRSDWIVDSFSL